MVSSFSVLLTGYVLFLNLLCSSHCKSLHNSSFAGNDKKREVLRSLFVNLENDKYISKLIVEMKTTVMNQHYIGEIHKIRQIKNGTFIHSNSTENIKKNRYKTILCYDHTRVVLSTENNSSDYINANYVDGYNRSKGFIMTEGKSMVDMLNHSKTDLSTAPQNITVDNFWRMIWDQKTLVIAMVTNVTESKMKILYLKFKFSLIFVPFQNRGSNI